MRDAIISALEALYFLVLVVFVAAGLLLGGSAVGAMMNPLFPEFSILGAIAGAIVGLLAGIAVTGVVFILLDIRDLLRAQVVGEERPTGKVGMFASEKSAPPDY